MPRPPAGAIAWALAALLAATARADTGVRVSRIAGEPVDARKIVAVTGDEMVVATASGEARIPLSDVVEVGFATPPDPPPAWSATAVAIDLATGETVHGEIKGGDGRGVALSSALLGELKVPIDRIASIRFLRRLAQVPEPPDLRAADETDVVHLANGDRLACTVHTFAEGSVEVETTGGEKTAVAYDRMTALRVLGEAGKRPAGMLLVTVLRDGSQVIGAQPAVKDGRLRMRSLGGFDVDAALADVVACHVLSDRFAYLSDLPAAKTEVTPFWKTVAGDPAVLYAPRTDRSFTGRPLVCGGRTWVKGLGVYSGTSMTWNLDGKFSEFRTSVGLDDGAGPLGGVVFEVLVDGQSKWKSAFVRSAAGEGRGAPGPIAMPRLDVKDAKSLTLRVHSGDSEDPWPVADEADWLGAMLVR